MIKLQLGCGKTFKEGWINSNYTTKLKNLKYYDEMRKQGHNIVELDVTKTWDMFEDNTVDYIFSEHMIEHLKETDGLFCLKESYRVLKSGGIIRTIAPSRTFYENIVGNDLHEFVINYCKKIFRKSGTYSGAAKKISQRTLNEQGHHWVPTEKMLLDQHKAAGFINVKICDYNKSEHSEMNNIDMVDGIREWESIVVEGEKPNV